MCSEIEKISGDGEFNHVTHEDGVGKGVSEVVLWPFGCALRSP